VGNERDWFRESAEGFIFPWRWGERLGAGGAERDRHWFGGGGEKFFYGRGREARWERERR